VVPDLPGLRFQAVHSHDVGDAYRLAVLGDVRGAFNIAAEPVLDGKRLAQLLAARAVPVPVGLARALATLSWRLRLQPTPPGWLDLGLTVPLMDTQRARNQLGWTPQHTGADAILDMLAGLREGAGIDTPPLKPTHAGPDMAPVQATARIRERECG
jgi:nucleoside-diphosphate-sugar epimerase